MKKNFLFAVALTSMMATTAHANDVYIIGSNVNGVGWELAEPSAKMTDKGNGVFEWTGDILGTAFKFNDGTWNNDYWTIGNKEVMANIGSDETVQLGIPTPVEDNGYSQNICFEALSVVENPHVILDLKAMTVTVTGAGTEAPDEQEYYLAGEFNGWQFIDSYKFTYNEGSGLYELLSVELGKDHYPHCKVSTMGWVQNWGLNADSYALSENNWTELVPNSDYNCVLDIIEEGVYDFFFKIEDHQASLMIRKASGTPIVNPSLERFQGPLYLIGSVNEWTLADPDYMMTLTAPGVFEWNGEKLSTIFKFNDGTWNNNLIDGTDIVLNIGSADVLELGIPSQLEASTEAPTIYFANDLINITDVHVVLDLNTLTLTVTGTPVENSTLSYYLVGDFNYWEFQDNCKFTYNPQTSLLELHGVELPVGEFKVSSEGWIKDWAGTPDMVKGEWYDLERGSSVNCSVENAGSYDFYLTVNGWNASLKYETAGEIPVNPSLEDFEGPLYLIGSVNGWNLADPDYMMTRTAPGVFEWNGEKLATSFKFNDGTWNNDLIPDTDLMLNIGSNGEKLELGTPLRFVTGGDSANFWFTEDILYIADAHVVLNLNNWTITVTGTPALDPDLTFSFISNFNDWDVNSNVFTYNEETGLYAAEGVRIEGEGEFKIVSQDLTVEFGGKDSEFVNESHLSCILTRNIVENQSIFLCGVYTVTFNYEDSGNILVEFTKTADIDLPYPPVQNHYIVTVAIEEGAEFAYYAPVNAESSFFASLEDENWVIESISIDGLDPIPFEEPKQSIKWTLFYENNPAIISVILKAAYQGNLQILEETGMAKLENDVEVKVAEGKVEIYNLTVGEEICLYTAGGHIIKQLKASNTEMSISLDSGIYVIRIGENAVKVIL